MAILLTARKTNESETQVEYEFGMDEQFDRMLTINKVTGEVSAVDGSVDSSVGMMSVKIKKMSRQTGEYPNSAVYAA